MDDFTGPKRRFRHDRGPAKHFMGGAILVVLGVIFLLDNLGILRADQFIGPSILILIGLGLVATPWSRGRALMGGFLVLGGGLLLLRNLGYIYGRVWGLFWPLLLVAVGVLLLIRAVEGPKEHWRAHWHARGERWPGSDKPASPNVLNEHAVFGNIQRRIDSQEFEGGEAHAVFGGIELDLRQAGTKREDVDIQANAVFGGIELWVPATWDITVAGAGVFGAYEDKTLPTRLTMGEKRPHLVVRGGAVFGNVTVKN